MTKKANRAPVNYLEVDDFERIVSNLRAMRAEFTEDIPPFGTRYTGTLEGIVNKAVWLFYCLIKNHPFFNGNKRVAVVALFDFLKRNVSELYIDEGAILHDLFRMAIRTSESDPAEIEQVKRYLRRKIRSFILEF